MTDASLIGLEQGSLAIVSADPSERRAYMSLAAACLGMFCGMGGVIFYTFAFFVIEISKETGWSATQLAASIGAGSFCSSLIAPLTGRACDKWGVRAVMMTGGFAFAAGLSVLGLVPWNAASFMACLMVAYSLAFASTPLPFSHLVAGWFNKRRGMAIGTIFCFGAIGIGAWPTIAATLIQAVGWRYAYVAMGCSGGLFLSCLRFCSSEIRP